MQIKFDRLQVFKERKLKIEEGNDLFEQNRDLLCLPLCKFSLMLDISKLFFLQRSAKKQNILKSCWFGFFLWKVNIEILSTGAC